MMWRTWSRPVTALLAAALAPAVGGSGREALRALRRDGAAHPSPNAGRCEAAFAGALGVRLGGTNVYQGQAERRGTLGDGPPPPPPTSTARSASPAWSSSRPPSCPRLARTCSAAAMRGPAAGTSPPGRANPRPRGWRHHRQVGRPSQTRLVPERPRAAGRGEAT